MNKNMIKVKFYQKGEKMRILKYQFFRVTFEYNGIRYFVKDCGEHGENAIRLFKKEDGEVIDIGAYGYVTVSDVFGYLFEKRGQTYSQVDIKAFTKLLNQYFNNYFEDAEKSLTERKIKKINERYKFEKKLIKRIENIDKNPESTIKWEDVKTRKTFNFKDIISLNKENNKQEKCKFCIDNSKKYEYDSPSFREDFEFHNILISFLVFRDRAGVRLDDYQGITALLETQKFKFCPYCGKEL
jgi:hypothetical protein